MKKIYLMLLLAGLVACNKENPDGGGDEQALTCEISIPEDGTTIDLAEIQALTSRETLKSTPEKSRQWN